MVAGVDIGFLKRRVTELELALAATERRLSFQSARDTLDELARLPADWDSYGAVPPTAVAMSSAHGLLSSLAEQYAGAADERALPWATAPLADGGVQFEWRGPGGAIEVEIGPDGRLAYLIERDGRTVGRSTTETVGVGDVLGELGRVLEP